jgi:hypothetical protein
MDGDYVFLCGVMWCAYGLRDAASELLRAATSADADLSALALAMLAQHSEYRPVNSFSTSSRGTPMWMRFCPVCKAMLQKRNLCGTTCSSCGWRW